MRLFGVPIRLEGRVRCWKAIEEEGNKYLTLSGALNSVANANGLVISVLLTVTFADVRIGEVLQMRHSV